MKNYKRPSRMKMYAIIGYDKEFDQYIGYYYRKNMATTNRVSCFTCTNFKYGSLRKNEKPNSKNQEVWFKLRRLVNELRKKEPYYNWKVYRIGSKYCPVIVNKTVVYNFENSANNKFKDDAERYLRETQYNLVFTRKDGKPNEHEIKKD